MSSESPETRIRILKATLHLLENKEGKDVRMSDIAKKAGVSRQAVYLHFSTRTQLLIETTKYLDGILDVQSRLVPSRTAATGIKRLEAYVDAWSAFIPEIYGISKALLTMSETDKEAADAWRSRMRDMREGCEAAIKAMHKDKTLSKTYSVEQAIDLLWTLMSVRNWEHLTQECGFSQTKYADSIKTMAKTLFVKST